jgi:Fur family ferric uptake transcriptional regulator
MEKVEILLEQKSVRVTAMRQLILEYFLKEQKTASLRDLEAIFNRADRITIYRTLKTFEEKGILHSIENGANEVRYALCNEHCTKDYHIDTHPHFHCEKCKNITCLEAVELPQVALPMDYQAKEITVMIKGICPGCK